MLGSVVPNVEGGASAVPAATSNADEKAGNEAKAKEAVKVDPSQPTTNIQVRRIFHCRVCPVTSAILIQYYPQF